MAAKDQNSATHAGLARVNFKEALGIYQNLENRDGSAAALDDIGDANVFLEEFDEAVAHYEAALDIYDKSDNLAGESQMLFNVGYAYQLKGDKLKKGSGLKEARVVYEHAIKKYQDSLNKRKEIGDIPGQVALLTNLGEVYRSLEMPSEASNFFRQAQALQPPAKP